MAMSYAALKQLTLDFTEAFNQNDLEAVLGFMSEDSIYFEYDGTVSRGKEAVRKAFEPQFAGAFGEIRFREEDMMIDAEAQKSLIRWRCEISKSDGTIAWQGLDILHVQNGKIVEKHTYAKAKKLLLNPV